MIISRTPFRISFFGGGTDYPEWYLQNEGSVVSTTINKYCYISCRQLPPFFEYKHRIVWSQIELVKNYDEIKHPVVREVLKAFDIQTGLEVHHDGDLPARSGMGSSSAFTIGFLNVIKELRKDPTSKKELACQGLYFEQEVLREAVGSQDQIAAAYGGFNRIDFKTDGTFDVNPLIVQEDRLELLENSLLLVFTGLSRTAAEVAKDKISHFSERTRELNGLKHLVDEGISILQSPKSSLEEFGKLLNEGWQLKRSLSPKVSNQIIDSVYEKAIKAGAVGGKLLGAGGGGFFLFFVPPERQARFKAQIAPFASVNLKFEYEGSKIVLNDKEA